MVGNYIVVTFIVVIIVIIPWLLLWSMPEIKGRQRKLLKGSIILFAVYITASQITSEIILHHEKMEFYRVARGPHHEERFDTYDKTLLNYGGRLDRVIEARDEKLSNSPIVGWSSWTTSSNGESVLGLYFLWPK